MNKRIQKKRIKSSICKNRNKYCKTGNQKALKPAEIKLDCVGGKYSRVFTMNRVKHHNPFKKECPVCHKRTRHGFFNACPACYPFLGFKASLEHLLGQIGDVMKGKGARLSFSVEPTLVHIMLDLPVFCDCVNVAENNKKEQKLVSFTCRVRISTRELRQAEPSVCKKYVLDAVKDLFEKTTNEVKDYCSKNGVVYHLANAVKFPTGGGNWKKNVAPFRAAPNPL